MFSTTAFTIVLVPYHNPWNILSLKYSKLELSENLTIPPQLSLIYELIYNIYEENKIINRQTEQKDGWMNGTTDRCKPVYPSLFQSEGIKYHYSKYGKKENPTKMVKNKHEAGLQSHIQYIIINLHTEYDYSRLHDFTEILEENFHYSKYGKEENWTNTGKNKHEKAGSQSHKRIHHYQPAYQI